MSLPIFDALRKLLVLLMLGAAIGAVQPIWAQDMALVAENLRLRQYPVAVGEQVLGDTKTIAQPYTLTRFGSRWLFLDHFDAELHRLWRSPVLPVGACAANLNARELRFYAQDIGNGDVAFSISGCGDGARLWFSSKEGDIGFFNASTPEHITLVGGDAVRLGNAYAYALSLQRIRNADYAKVVTPSSVTVTISPSPEPHLLGRIITQAGTALQAGQAPAELVPRILTQLERLDWRSAPLSAAQIDSMGLVFSASDECHDIADAALMLEEVLRREPQYAVAHLHLGDAYGSLSSAACHRYNPITNKREAMLDEYRLYCQAEQPQKIDRATTKRLSQALKVTQLDSAVCHPQYSLFRAIDNDDINALDAALADEALDPNQVGTRQYTALAWALEKKKGEMARRIIASGRVGEDIRNDERTIPLVAQAIFNNDVQTLDALIAADAPLKAGKGGNYVPLIIAAGMRSDKAERESIQITMLQHLIAALTRKGEVKYQYGSNKETPLMEAANNYSSRTVIDMLQKAGYFINAQDVFGRTALHKVGPFLKTGEAAATLQILLEAGANPNQQDRDGKTPLVHLFAYSRGDPDAQAAMVRVLLEHGADPNIADEEGRTALDKAAWMPLPDTVDLLLAHGAKVSPLYHGDKPLLARLRRRIEELSDPSSYEAKAGCSCLADYQPVEASLVKAGIQ